MGTGLDCTGTVSSYPVLVFTTNACLDFPLHKSITSFVRHNTRARNEENNFHTVQGGRTNALQERKGTNAKPEKIRDKRQAQIKINVTDF